MGPGLCCSANNSTTNEPNHTDTPATENTLIGEPIKLQKRDHLSLYDMEDEWTLPAELFAEHEKGKAIVFFYTGDNHKPTARTKRQ